MSPAVRVCLLAALLVIGCDGGDGGVGSDVDATASDVDAGSSPDGALACGTPAECAAYWEQRAADRLDAILGDPTALTTFLRDVPKGGDLHNHLSGAVYAETYLEWARDDADCINTSTHTAVYASQCSTSTQPVPVSGAFYDQIVRAWSMQDFVAGAQTGRDHFFATFSKFGAVAGAHRNDSIADVARRAADENQVYVETMFNLGTNVGSLAASVWSGTLTATDLPTFYSQLKANAQFATRLTSDLNAVTSAGSGYRTALGCADANPPPACDVVVRFTAQVSRTGANDQIFGQLVSAFEMGAMSPQIVGVNLSSPEDNTSALNNYELHMAMLDFLYQTYTVTALSPMRVSLHAGELVPSILPPGSTANTFHIRRAVEVAHASRIGHGVDILSETNSAELLGTMRDRGVLVEVCLSSNDQILEVSGASHPLAQYLASGVPVALATDDQGVSRSSMAGEYRLAIEDQQLRYRQLKAIARNSLEHAFLPGTSLWSSLGSAQPVATCPLWETPSSACQQLLDASARAHAQWDLEQRFLTFERAQ